MRLVGRLQLGQPVQGGGHIDLIKIVHRICDDVQHLQGGQGCAYVAESALCAPGPPDVQHLQAGKERLEGPNSTAPFRIDNSNRAADMSNTLWALAIRCAGSSHLLKLAGCQLLTSRWHSRQP